MTTPKLTGTRVLATYYGTRDGFIIRETPTRVQVQFEMRNRIVAKWYRKADQVASHRNVVQLGTWAALDLTPTPDAVAPIVTIKLRAYGGIPSEQVAYHRITRDHWNALSAQERHIKCDRYAEKFASAVGAESYGWTIENAR
jgi:hypothetical protein